MTDVAVWNPGCRSLIMGVALDQTPRETLPTRIRTTGFTGYDKRAHGPLESPPEAYAEMEERGFRGMYSKRHSARATGKGKVDFYEMLSKRMRL